MPNVKIQALKDGPLVVTGAVDIIDSQGAVIKTESNVALCRCGQSGNKPFCDGSHKKVGFQSVVVATNQPKV